MGFPSCTFGESKCGSQNSIGGLPIEHPLCGEATGASIFPVPALLYDCFTQ